jgi:hypothetical protein
MGALEYHHIDQILRKFNVDLPSQVVAALADAARDVAREDEVPGDLEASPGASNVPSEVRTLEVMNVRPVVDGEAQPCLRAIIHGHFLRKRGERGREAAAAAHESTQRYLAALSVTAEEVQATPGSEAESAGGMSQGLACAAELCQDYVDQADNYQKRLAAFQCVKRIRDALAEFDKNESAKAPAGCEVAARTNTPVAQAELPPQLASLKAVAWQRRCMVNGSAITGWMDLPEECIEVELNLGNDVRELFPGPVIRGIAGRPPVMARLETMSAADLFGAQNRLLSWNRRQSKPPIAIGMEYSVAAAAVEALAGAQA